MAKVRVMYWKEIPVQVQASDETGQVSQPLNKRFQQGVDLVATLDGSNNSEEYLEAWEWGEYTETEGSPQEAAVKIATRLNEEFPTDFVDKIRDLQRSGERDPRPGAVDHWIEK